MNRCNLPKDYKGRAVPQRSMEICDRVLGDQSLGSRASNSGSSAIGQNRDVNEICKKERESEIMSFFLRYDFHDSDFYIIFRKIGQTHTR